MRALKYNVGEWVLIGPFVAYDDGVTEKASLTLADITCRIVKGVTASALTLVASGATGSERNFAIVGGGYWKIQLVNGDCDPVGRVRLTFQDEDVILPVWEDFVVLPAQVYDSLFAGTDLLDANAAQVAGAAVASGSIPNVAAGASGGLPLQGGAVPNANAGSVGGLPTVDASNKVAGVVDKAGFKLASDGLDALPTTTPAGVASTFREMLVQVWRRFFKKSAMTSTQLKTYADNGTTVLTTQAVSDDGTTQTQGAAE